MIAAAPTVPQPTNQEPLLVVEDDVGLSRLMCQRLAPLGRPADAVGTAEAAVENLTNSTPALLLLDYRLPDHNADWILDQIAARERPRPPFVVITGHGNEEVAVAMMRRGALDYLIKDHGFLDRLAPAVERALREAALIAELEQARHQREETTRTLQTLVANIPGGVYRCRNDRRWTMEYLNPGIVELCGYPASAILGGEISWSEIVEPEDRQRIWEEVQAANAEGRPFDLVYRIRCQDGELRWVFERGRAVPTTPGAPLTLEGIFTDLTRQKELEEKGRRLTLELAGAQRIESLGVLAGGIAHDFNNLLTAITGNLSLLAPRLEPDEAAHVHEALAAAKDAAQLTQQLITFARGGAPFKQAVDPISLVRDAAGLALRGSAAALLFTAADEVPAVEVDESQIRQVVINLVRNAVEAQAGHGTVRVTVDALAPTTAPAGLANSACVRIIVADSGPGIRAEDLGHIFEPYFTTKARGQGLGLAVSRSVAVKHGGALTVESEPDRGSALTLWLPASTATAVPLSAPAVAAVPELSRGRVLVMDDEPAVRKVACRMLAGLGCAVEAAADGETALAACADAVDEGRPFDVVILDLTVPGGLGGREIVGQVRAMLPAARLIVSSGYSDTAAMSNFEEAGFDAALAKPYDFQRFSTLLFTELGRRRG